MRRLWAAINALLRPSRIARVTVTPAGWLLVGRRDLLPILGWGLGQDGATVALVAAGRGGLKPARGSGYLPPRPHGPGDVQPEPPAVSFPVTDLDEAVGDDWTPGGFAAILARLREAGDAEWARPAYLAFAADPDKFLGRYIKSFAEHHRPAQLDAAERAGWAGLVADDSPSTPNEPRPQSGRGEPS